MKERAHLALADAFLFLRTAESIAKTTPTRMTTAPRAITFKSSWGISNPEDNNPTRGIRGILPIVRGVLNSPLKLGFRYLRTIADRLTDAKIINVPKLVTSATNCMSPKNTRRQEAIVVTRIAVQGVPLAARANDDCLESPCVLGRHRIRG